MSYFIDEVAKTLAAPASRRKAFRRIVGMKVGGVFLASC